MSIRDQRSETEDGRQVNYDAIPQAAAVPDVSTSPLDRSPSQLSETLGLGHLPGGSQPAATGASRAAVSLALVNQLDQRIVELAARWLEPAARIAIFVIYFYFGFLKVLNLSPATPLARALTDQTIGAQYFNASYHALAVYECLIGILFLIPAMTRISTVLVLIHLVIVSSPLILVANLAWTGMLVPTFEGQYIIKNLAILALVIGITAQRHSSRRKQ